MPENIVENTENVIENNQDKTEMFQKLTPCQIHKSVLMSQMLFMK